MVGKLTLLRIAQATLVSTFMFVGIVCQLWAATHVGEIPLDTLCEAYSGSGEVMEAEDFNDFFNWVDSVIGCSNRECLSYEVAAGYFLTSNERSRLSGQVDRLRYASEVFYCKHAPHLVFQQNVSRMCGGDGISGSCKLWPGQPVARRASWYLPLATASYDGPVFHVSCADKLKVFGGFLRSILVFWTDEDLAAAESKFYWNCLADKGGTTYILAAGPIIAIFGAVLTLVALHPRFSGPPISDVGPTVLGLSVVLLLVGFWCIGEESSNHIAGKFQVCSGIGPPLSYQGRWYDKTPCIDVDTFGEENYNPFVVAIILLRSVYIAGGVLNLAAIMICLGLRLDLSRELMHQSLQDFADNLLQEFEESDFLPDGADASFWEPDTTHNEPVTSVTNAEFSPSMGLSTGEAEELLKQWGRNELVDKVIPFWLIILRLLTGPMPIMLWIAAVIEGCIGNFVDMGILLGIQFINAGISFYETTKAGNAVAALKASLKPLATVNRDGKWQTMEACRVVPGDLVMLAAGSAVPADCWINEGEIEVDQSAMTGESLPVKFRRGDVCKMGSTVTRGEVHGTVETTGSRTFFGKTAAMLQSVDSSGGSLQSLLLHMMMVLVTLSMGLCVTAFIFLLVAGQADNSNLPEIHQKSSEEISQEALSFAVVVLVASIPLAVEIVTTTTLAVGSRFLSSHGAIVTRLASIEEMAGMDMLCSDKTGTLTLNKMVIQDDCPVFQEGETKASIMFQAALAAKWKEPPRDALDTMVLKTGLSLPQAGEGSDSEGQKNREALDAYTQLDFIPFDPRTKRTEGRLQGPHGDIFRITKGAPNVILNLATANNLQIREAVEKKVQDLGSRGIRALAVARADGEDGPWRFLGILTFLDPPRPDTKQTIADARAMGVEVKMITGDHVTIAVETARALGMGTQILGPSGLPVLGEGGKVPESWKIDLFFVMSSLADHYGGLIVPSSGFAQVFPEHKFLIVECLRQAGFRVGMTGDGVNDAPALKRADVGIAVAGSTDAARAAADIVLTGEGLSVCIIALRISRQIFSRLKNFVVYRISATLQLLFFFFLAVFLLSPRSFYVRHGIAGLDTVSNDPKVGGYANTTTFDRVYIFALPRQSFTCPGGLEGASADPRLQQHLDLVTQTTIISVESVPHGSGISEILPSRKHRQTIKYFNVDAMHPEWPGIDGWDPGCSVILPICHESTRCLDADSGGAEVCPKFQVCSSWPYFFQLPVLMLMLITLLNDGALISIGYDNVSPSPVPERWNLRLVFAVSSILGAVACSSSLLLLWAALDSNNPHGVFAAMGLPALEYGKIITMMYLKVSLSDFLTLFSSRVQDDVCIRCSRPAPALAFAAGISLFVSTLLASFWPLGQLDGLPVMGLALGDYSLMPLWIWIYCIVCWMIQDVSKVFVLRICANHVFFRTLSVDRRRYEVLNAGNEESQPRREKRKLRRRTVSSINTSVTNGKIERIGDAKEQNSVTGGGGSGNAGTVNADTSSNVQIHDIPAVEDDTGKNITEFQTPAAKSEKKKGRRNSS